MQDFLLRLLFFFGPLNFFVQTEVSHHQNQAAQSTQNKAWALIFLSHKKIPVN